MNRVTSVVSLFTTPKVAEQIRILVDTGDEKFYGFNFNRLIPEPAGLEPTFNDADISPEEDFHRVITYGASNLDEWRRLYWGCSSPNILTSWFNNQYFKLETADTPPLGIFKTISNQFDAFVCVVYTSEEESGVIICRNGSYKQMVALPREAIIIRNLVDDRNYTYEKWEEQNKTAGKRLKLDMKLLFMAPSELLVIAKNILYSKIFEIVEEYKNIL